jgi:hypothetical protein
LNDSRTNRPYFRLRGQYRRARGSAAAIKQHAPDSTVVAGDILASPFSPDPPSETIALLRSEPVQAIPGNTDRYLLDWGTPRWAHTLWMRLRRSDPAGTWLDDMAAGQALIAPADLAWLRSLPEEFLLTEGVWVCHGMPGQPVEFHLAALADLRRQRVRCRSRCLAAHAREL